MAKKVKEKAFKPYPESKQIGDEQFMEIIMECSDKELYVWHLKTGERIWIKDLRDTHLERIVETFKHMPNWRIEQQPLIHAEIDRRKKKKLIKSSNAGKILYANGRNASTAS